jgi:hypothetical protein
MEGLDHLVHQPHQKLNIRLVKPCATDIDADY